MLISIRSSQTEAQTDPSALPSTTWQLPLLVFLTTVSVALSLFLAVYAWRRRNKPGVLVFAWFMTAVVECSIASALSILSQTAETARFWTNLIFLGNSAVPVLFLIFILQYSGRERWLSRRRIGMLFIIPLLTQVVIWTDDMHGLFIRQAHFSRQGALMLVQTKRLGPWFGVQMGYHYLLLAIGIIYIVSMIIRPFRLYRKQAVGLLIGIIPPMLTGILIRFDLIPGLQNQLTPFSLSLMGSMFAWALFRHEFLNVVPVARDALIDSMSEGMLVLDIQHRIVDLNPAAQVLLDTSSSQCIGQSAFDVLHFWPGLIKHLHQDNQVQAEIELDHPTTHHHYHSRISLLTDKRERQAGTLIMLRDITERKRTEMELDHHRHRLEELVSERTEELRQEILERRRAERQLTLSLQEKSILLQEIHHRVKNNLQVIHSLLNLQSSLVKDDYSHSLFHESQQRVKTMALIHEKLYQSESLHDINFREYVRSLASELYASYQPLSGPVELVVDVADIHLHLDPAILCGLVITELMSNAFKYGVPSQNGRVTLTFSVSVDHQYELRINDNGPGLPANIDLETFGSLGLQLVRGLVEEQLGGTLELGEGPGTAWIIRFHYDHNPVETVEKPLLQDF
jgi:PAS domain S-box-containing protein